MEFQSPLADLENYCSGAWPTRFEGNLDREGSPSINLGLWISAGPIDEGRPIFTAQQLHELNHQALIFKYIIAGLCVPVHLVVPIWKSVSCSFGSSNLGIYNQYSNQYPSIPGFSRQSFNQRTAMDPEPGRCRRTDGKKWRCSKNAVHDQKYCERHMHRGHQRSRKHVEASQSISQSDKTTETTTTNTKNNDSYAKRADISDDSKRSFSVGTETGAKKTTGSTLSGAATDHKTGRNKSYYVEGKDAGFKYADDANRNSYNGNKSKFARFLAPGFGSSPRSIVHDGTAVSGSTPGFESRTLVDTEPNRCRRTDGKKWRCSHEVVPEQKYCAWHIHRGGKKTKVPSEMVTVASPPPRPVSIPEKATINLNTRITCSSEGNYTSSSSDATTVTDENTSFARVSVRFP